MGAWGSATFENDTALDILGDVIESLVHVIERDLKATKTKAGAGDLERPTMAAVAIMASLAKGIPSARRMFATSQVDRWESEYFKWFDESFVPHVDATVAKRVRATSKSELRKRRKLASGAEQ